VLLKGIEKILCDHFVEYIESCGFFCQVFGLERFHIRFHSTPTALTSIMDGIHLSVERSGRGTA
jgi:hypothetical protein